MPIYLFYVAVGKQINNQKTCPCLPLFSCSCINKQIIQSFTCIFKIIFNYESVGGGGHLNSILTRYDTQAALDVTERSA